jgi:disulfide bond formation protein DsbB
MRKSYFIFLFSIVLSILLVACGGGGGDADEPTEASGDATAGADLYQGTCAACHGPDAKGLPNLGKDLTSSEFVSANSDQELLAFVKEGRPADHPDNTTGVAMLPKGGNPALTDQDILDIIAFVRSLP